MRLRNATAIARSKDSQTCQGAADPMRNFILSIFALLLFCAQQPASAAPKPKLWPHWESHDAASVASIDHGAWDRWLDKLLKPSADGINRVDYAAVTAADRAALRAYIDALAGLDIGSYNRDQQRAYWINLYNAVTVDIVLEHYPLESIRDISAGLFSSGPWKLELVSVDGKDLSLDDIEHRILRPIWRDPRIHYAVNCASLGCPNLQPRAFTAANTEELLERGAREFVNHERGARIVDGRLEVSSIYEWFDEDFGGNDRGVIEHLRRYAEPALATALEGIDRIGDDSYDWRLNAAGDS